jgi:hypothetical protein
VRHRRVAGAVVLVAASAGAGAASAATASSSASRDVGALEARESAVLAQLRSYPGPGAGLARWEARLRSTEAAQAAAEAALDRDLAPAPRPAPGNEVLIDESGSGSGSHATFDVPPADGGWSLRWTYDCGSAPGAFAVAITGSGSAAGTTDFGPTEVGTKGSGTKQYHDAGTFNLRIVSTCTWSIEVLAG